jgi:hypothetical protein
MLALCPLALSAHGMQAHEIAAVAWLDKEEYFGQNFQAGVPLYDTLRGRCQAWAEGR